MARYGMVIDLGACVGCGACAIACKTENNTGDRAAGQTHNWADFVFTLEGTFPDVRALTLPVMCNHCSNAPCVAICPTTPKAMFKTPDGLTMHNDERCIGCRMCQEACPYSVRDVDEAGAPYSVISYNESAEIQHARYGSTVEALAGGTGSGAEVASLAGATPPYRTDYEHPEYDNVRRGGIVEKCYMCAHRLAEGELPYCVESCPAGARIFGDLDDPNSAPNRALEEHESFRYKEEAGTEPNVHYIRSFQAD